MSERAPEFRNLEEILAAHETLAKELDAIIGEGSRDDERPRAILEAFRGKVEVFLDRIARSGVWLYYDTDRVSAVGHLSGWVNDLYRLGCYGAGERPPKLQLAPFDATRQEPLRDEDFPYTPDAELGSRGMVGDLWNRHVKMCLECLSRPAQPDTPWTRLLVIAGAPGSGRSSLLHDALAPALASTPLAPGAPPVQPLPAFMPGRKPLTALVAHLSAAGLAPNRPLETLAAELLVTPAVLADWLRPIQPPRALLVDNLEDVFTLGALGAEQEAFVEALRLLAADSGSGHAVVAVFDSEFTGRLAGLGRFFEAAGRGWVGLNLDPNELRLLIVAPARRIGLLFEEGLAEQLVADIQGDPAAITLVQFTLRRLWQRRLHNTIPWTAYQELCSGRLALDLAATETLNRFAPESSPDRARRAGIVRAIFLSLIRPEAGGGVRVLPLRPTQLEQRITQRWLREARPQPPSPSEIQEAVEMFCHEQLLTRHGDGEISLAHEAMISRWQSLIEWLDVERGEARQRGVLRADAEHWEVVRKDPSKQVQAKGLLYPARKLEQLAPVQEELRHEIEDPDDPGYGRVALEFLEASAAQAESAYFWHRFRWAAGIAAAVLAVAGFISVQQMHLAREQKSAMSLRKSTMSLYVNRGSTLLADADPAGALLWFAEARAKEQKDEESGEAHAMSLAIAARQLPDLAAFLVTDTLTSADLSPTGDRALLALRRQGARSGGVWLWPVSRPNEMAIPLADGETSPRAVFSADGLRAAIALGEPGGDHGALEIWDVKAQPPARLARTDFKTVITDLAFHPNDSNRVAGCAASDGENSGDVALYELKDGKISSTPMRGGAVQGAANCLAFSPGGDRLAVGYTVGETGRLRVFDLEKGIACKPADENTLRPVTSVSFSPDPGGAFIAAATITRAGNAGDARIYRCDSKTSGDLPLVIPPLIHSDGGGVTSASFSPAGTRLRLLTTSAAGTASVWDAGTGRLLASLPHPGWVFSATWSPDGGKVATGGRDRTVRVWDANSGEMTLPPLHHGGTVSSLRFSPDGARLLAVTQAYARVWETHTRERSILPLPTASSATASIASNSGKLFAAAPSAMSRWGHLLVFTLDASLKPEARLDAETEVKLVAISADDEWIAAINNSNELLIWPVKTEGDIFKWRKPSASIPLPKDTMVKLLGFSGPEKPHVFVVHETVQKSSGKSVTASTVEIYDVATGKKTREPIMLGFRASAMAASPDGARLAFGGGETRPRIGRACWFAIDSTAPPTALVAKGLAASLKDACNDEPVLCLAFSPNGERLITGSADDTLAVWDLTDGARLWQARHTADVSSVSFSGSGNFVLSTSFDSTAIVRNATDGAERATAQHQGTVRSGVFSPDEHYFATGGDDRTARLWSRESGDLIAVLPHTCEVARVNFDATQSSLITFGLRAPPLASDPTSRATRSRTLETRRWSILGSAAPHESFRKMGQLLGSRELDTHNQQLRLLDATRLDALWKEDVASRGPTPASDRITDFHLSEAHLAEAAGDTASAAWHLRECAKLSPESANDAELLADQARVYSDVTDWDRAITSASAALQLAAGESWQDDMLEYRAYALLQRGRIRHQSGDLEAALADYVKLADNKKSDTLWRTRQAEALYLLARPREALDKLDEASGIETYTTHFQKKAAILLSMRNAALNDPDKAGDGAKLNAEYKEVCKKALEVYGGKPGVTSAAWCVVLGESSGVDLPVVSSQVEATLADSSTDWLRRNTLGALLYRLGGNSNTDRAITLLTESSQLYERSDARLRRDPLSLDPTLPPGRPVDWIFLAMAHARLGAQTSLPESEQSRHQAEAKRYRAAVSTVLQGEMLDGFSASRAAWNRLDLEILGAEFDREQTRVAGPP